MISLPFRVNKNLKPYNAAVIGGGITGLTAALRLSENPECSKVTLYEKSSRLGGYVQSETIPIDGGKVVFEYGPRTIRSFVNPIEYHAFLDLVRASYQSLDFA